MNATARIPSGSPAGSPAWVAPGLEALAWLNPMWVRAMSEMSAEIADFVSERVREDFRTRQALLECRDPVEFHEIQGRFLKAAFDQYCAETERLCRLNREVLDQLTGRSGGS